MNSGATKSVAIIPKSTARQQTRCELIQGTVSEICRFRLHAYEFPFKANDDQVHCSRASARRERRPVAPYAA